MQTLLLRPKVCCLLVLAAICGPLGIAALAQNAIPSSTDESKDRDAELRQLRELVLRLQARVEQLEAHQQASDPGPQAAEDSSAAADGREQGITAPQTFPSSAAADRTNLDFLKATTIDVGLDVYYGYNFNYPIGRVNLLRAYDVSSNAFSLNQASLIVKNEPDVSADRRFGVRLDLQFGQATSTLQGNPGNEPRPDVYRNIFQAYGTYVFPAGNGLTVDVGKWASSLGIEGNYSKDQMSYSRSYWFDFLPFYHMGARVNYKFNDQVALNYWVVNGNQQVEPFNGFKDQLVGFVVQPTKNINWTSNYYLGQEHPDVVFFPNGGAPPGSPTQQSVPFQPIPNAPSGKLHILDTYVTWQAAPKLTFAGEADYVIQRLQETSPPAHTSGGAAYARYQATSKVGLAGRAEYLSDRGGLFSGKTQALKEVTLTYEYKLAEGLTTRLEWRRDWSNQPFFFTDQLGVLSNHQNTATLGLIWWWGNKMGEGW
jgi:hypothetical protein